MGHLINKTQILNMYSIDLYYCSENKSPASNSVCVIMLTRRIGNDCITCPIVCFFQPKNSDAKGNEQKPTNALENVFRIRKLSGVKLDPGLAFPITLISLHYKQCRRSFQHEAIKICYQSMPSYATQTSVDWEAVEALTFV